MLVTGLCFLDANRDVRIVRIGLERVQDDLGKSVPQRLVVAGDLPWRDAFVERELGNFFSGMIGIGGGIILSPIILLLHWADMKQTAAVSALFILVNSLAGLGGLFQNPPIAEMRASPIMTQASAAPATPSLR